MINKLCLTRNDSEDIAFVISCLIAQAISRDEFQEWLYFIISNSDEDLPLYIYELVDFSSRLADIYKVIEIPISWNPSVGEEKALDGIAYKRGVYDKPLTYDVHISREDALKALADNPHIEQRFRETFPFIQY